jgi:hypothetical protein
MKEGDFSSRVLPEMKRLPWRCRLLILVSRRISSKAGLTTSMASAADSSLSGSAVTSRHKNNDFAFVAISG